ncbi:hypothetical protein BDN72DRAFT_897017 [Pluteus cervinus]|uniref:Uncharacterized protein n=1 Tax=Pluteus cervinus TaxID=181527 RepID=A0ACD3AVF6_9AGAR|nr:hypothetical protein BDN72DRAFT_897017 [Pluteus cervinus]
MESPPNPISRLHNEIMQQIFVSSTPISKRSQDVGKARLSLTWVCQSWRKLAQQTSELWSYIDFINPTWVEAALSRTQNRQLSFDFFLPWDHQEDLNRLASLSLGNLPRITTLSIASTYGSDLDIFPRMCPLWGAPASSLVELTLYSVSLPSNLFLGTFPTLQKLTLDTCELNWDALPVWAGLQNLWLSNPIPKISVDSFASKLQVVASEVEELYLHNVLLPIVATHHANPATPQTRYHLKNIRSFVLNEPQAPPITSILNQLSLPLYLRETSIRVEPMGSGGVIQDQFDLARAFVASRTLQLAPWPVTAVDVYLLDGEIAISLKEESPTTGVNVKDNVEKKKNSSIGLSFDLLTPSSISQIIPIFSILPLPPVQSLTFSGGRDRNYGPGLTDYFNSDTQGAVRSLNVIIHYIPTFNGVINAQSRRLRELTGTRGNLEVEQVNGELVTRCRDILGFHHLDALCYYAPYGDDELQLSWDDYRALREWLMWRRNAGLKLRKLVFKDMNIPDEARLRTLFDSNGGVVDTLEFVNMDLDAFDL